MTDMTADLKAEDDTPENRRIAEAARALGTHMYDCKVCSASTRYGTLCDKGQELSDRAVANVRR